MRDAFEMWRSTKMVVLVALSAGVYAAVLIPFKPLPLVPGVTEIRLAMVFPLVCSLLFGPAGAWGAAFGNLIGDFFGTLTPASLFGFVGNFLYGYIPYRLWRWMLAQRPPRGAPADLPWLVVITIIAACCCAVFICFGLQYVFNMAPFHVVALMITGNNTLVPIVLAPLLLPLIYPRVRTWRLLAEDNMPPEELAPGRLCSVGAVLLTLGGPGVLALTLLTWGAGGPGPVVVGLGVVAIVVGALLLAPLPRLGRARQQEALAVLEAAAPGAPAIEVESLCFTYAGADRPALRGVGFAQQPGSIALLMGPTGAGKSTLCRCLAGLIPSYLRGDFRGTVRLNGADIAGRHVAELAQTIGLVFQDFETQLVSSDVRSEVAFALESFGPPRQEMRERVREALAAVRLAELAGHAAHRDPATLSGGEKQRLAIASVLASRPPILVLDEPTTDLDPAGKAQLFQVAKDLHEHGITLLIAEHETGQALNADRLLVLRNGELAFDGPPADLLRDPERTQQLALHPLEMPELFAALGLEQRPLTVQEAAELLTRGGCSLDEEQVAELRRSDDRRREAYGQEVLSVEGLVHRYGDKAALDGVSLEVREGEFVAILGQNGCGKTTLAKHLNGLLKPSEGRVLIGGRDSREAPIADLARIVGYVFQDPDHQIFEQRVDQEVAFGLRNLGVCESEVETRVQEALAAVGLGEKRAADPFTLTKGERQRLATASVLACQPQVIILDEPTTGLDGTEQRRMMELLVDLNRQGHTVIVITHCMWAAARYAHRVIVLSDGKVVADGSAREVFGNLDLLTRNSLEAPEVVQLSTRRFGATMLTVEELASCLEQVGRG